MTRSVQQLCILETWLQGKTKGDHHHFSHKFGVSNVRSCCRRGRHDQRIIIIHFDQIWLVNFPPIFVRPFLCRSCGFNTSTIADYAQRMLSFHLHRAALLFCQLKNIYLFRFFQYVRFNCYFYLTHSHTLFIVEYIEAHNQTDKAQLQRDNYKVRIITAQILRNWTNK